VFFGLSLSSISVGGNQFTNFILVALIELPAYVVFYFAMDRLGRRNTLCFSLILSGASCISFAFLPAGSYKTNSRLRMSLINKRGQCLDLRERTEKVITHTMS
jgi:OCT family organic cation transporter-like MFS transporter 4/5